MIMENEFQLAENGIYKIIPIPNFNKNKVDDCVVLLKIDIDSQFIHAAYGRQVMGILQKFFKNETEVLALELLPEALKENKTIVREEANKPGGDRFVHLYGVQKIPLAAVKKIFILKKQTETLRTCKSYKF